MTDGLEYDFKKARKEFFKRAEYVKDLLIFAGFLIGVLGVIIIITYSLFSLFRWVIGG